MQNTLLLPLLSGMNCLLICRPTKWGKGTLQQRSVPLSSLYLGRNHGPEGDSDCFRFVHGNASVPDSALLLHEVSHQWVSNDSAVFWDDWIWNEPYYRVSDHDTLQIVYRPQSTNPQPRNRLCDRLK